MSKTPQEASSNSQHEAANVRDSTMASHSNMDRRTDTKFGTYGVKLVSRLTMHDLKVVQNAFTVNQTGQERELSLDRNQFCEILSIVLNKGTVEEYGDLFDKIDVTKEGFVDWDKFCSHMLLEYYEKDDRMKTTQVPQWREMKTLPSPHKDVIKRLAPLNNPSRYISISKEGMVCTWALNMKPLRTVQIHTDQDEVKQRDLWVTDFIPMQNIYKVALALTSKEIAIYDLSSKTEFNCQFRVGGLEFTPLCMDYWSNPDDPNEAILVYGDVSGQVNALLFSAATITLFDRPSQAAGSKQDTYVNVDIHDVARGSYRNARIVKHHGHSEWTRQVTYSAHLDCFISCATTYKNSLVLGWIEKAKMNMRITQFKIPQGVSAFDYNEKMNLIATAGVNHHVCLWNPYVISKPVGVLRGHMQSVVAVQFIQSRGQLISLSKDKVLRIWDTHLQVCQQRLSGMFPKGPVDVSITMCYDEEHSKLFTAFNHQLTLMVMKAEVKDRIMSHEQPITAAIYNSKFNQVVSACAGSVITMWMVDTGQKVKQFANAHGNSEITALTQDGTQTRLFTGSADGNVKIWDFNGHCHNILMAGNGDPAEISQVLCLKRIIIAVGWERTLCVFRDGQINSFYVHPSEWKGRQEHQDDILSAGFCPPTTLATAGYDGQIVIWNLNSEQASRHLGTHTRRRSTLRQSRAKSRSRSRTDTPSSVGQSNGKERPDTKLSVHGTGSNLSLNEETGPDQDDGGYSVTKLVFLTERPMSASSNGANLVCCNAGGWVRFWNTHKSVCVGEFLAHQHAGSLMMAVDNTNQYLVTGDAEGFVKVWNIAEYSLRGKPERMTPPLLKQFQPHTDVINSIQLFTRNDRLLMLTASSDCSVALWDIKGRQIGVFGQEEHWKIEPIIEEEKEMEETDEEETQKERVEDKEKLPDDVKYQQDAGIFAGEPFDPNFKVATWENTILGKAYQESRGEKRERRQPQTIPNLPYLVWEKTGQPPAGPYAALDTADLQSVKPIQKPDFVSNPHKYFRERSASNQKKRTEKLPVLPSITDQLQMRYDEKSLFPKYILDMDAKMRTAHTLRLGGSRGSKFKSIAGINSVSPSRMKVLLAEHAAQGEKAKKAPNWNKMLIKRNSPNDAKADDLPNEA